MDMSQIPSEEQMLAQQEQKAAMQEQRDSILQQILEPAAKARLTALKLVKPDFAASVEDSLIRAGTTGQLKSIVSDAQLKTMLEQFAADGPEGSAAAKKKVTIQRRKTCESSDDDDDSDLL